VTTTEQVPVRPGITTRVSIQLTPEAVFLDELMVKGRPTPSDAQVRNFKEGEAREITGGGTAVDLLAATFSAIQVSRGSGQVGSGTSILIRGSNSLIMSGEPLVYLDGVRIGASSGPQSAETPMIVNFLDQIPADMVVRIEVLKGPAATKYGVGSSNGVILIYTR
jgi:outer membrane receptor protein involved in Fe transport